MAGHAALGGRRNTEVSPDDRGPGLVERFMLVLAVLLTVAFLAVAVLVLWHSGG